MTRIYYPDIYTQQLGPDQDILLEGRPAHYLLTVLRRKEGDNLTLFDGKNGEYQAVIKKISKKCLWLSFLNKQVIDRESPLTIHLIQGISKGERMDWVVQKATELGVSSITPVYTQHGAVSLNAERMLKKREHWENIIISACEQCGRNVIPVCDPIQSFSEALLMPVSEGGIRWILHPEKSATVIVSSGPAEPVGVALCGDPNDGRRRSARPYSSVETGTKMTGTDKTITHIQLMIGPEGGFSEAEMQQAQAAGFTSIQLGPRVLRTETAAIAAIATLQAVYGDGQ